MVFVDSVLVTSRDSEAVRDVKEAVHQDSGMFVSCAVGRCPICGVGHLPEKEVGGR